LEAWGIVVWKRGSGLRGEFASDVQKPTGKKRNVIDKLAGRGSPGETRRKARIKGETKPTSGMGRGCDF